MKGKKDTVFVKITLSVAALSTGPSAPVPFTPSKINASHLGCNRDIALLTNEKCSSATGSPLLSHVFLEAKQPCLITLDLH